MTEKHVPQDHFTEILQHRIKYWLSGENAPTELDDAASEHIETAIKGGYREGELFVYGDNDEEPYKGWWSIDFS